MTQASRSRFDGLLVFLVLFAAAGDPAPARNEPHYLCRLKHFWDAGYCPGDLFLDSPDAHFTVVWLLGWVTQFVSLETTAWLGRLASWGLLAWGWRRLVERVTPVPLMAPLGAALLVFLTEQGHFAGEWLVGGFEAKTLAYPLVLIALTEAIDGRWNRCWTLLGVASAFHALVGGWSVVALALAWTRTPDRPSLAAMAPGLALGGLIAMAGVGPALLLNRGVSAEVVAAGNQVYVFDRLAHHLAPLTKPWPWLIDRVLRHAVVVVLLWRLGRRLPAGDPSSARDQALWLLVRFAWGAVAISCAGFVIHLITWTHPETAASLLRYYWFRLADIAVPLAVTALCLAGLTKLLLHREPRALAVALVLLLLGGYQVGGHVIERVNEPFAEADGYTTDPAAWVEMCDWIRANTEPDTLFLTPRRSHSFKWRAERPEVVTYKDVPQNAKGLLEWRRRYLDVWQIGTWNSGKPRWAGSLSSLGAARLRELVQSYDADYVLSHDPTRENAFWPRRRASLPVAHQIGPYTLYDMRPQP